MSDVRRTAFVLFEIEGYSGEEIAELEQIPLATVYTRLHHARKDFLRLTAEITGEPNPRSRRHEAPARNRSDTPLMKNGRRRCSTPTPPLPESRERMLRVRRALDRPRARSALAARCRRWRRRRRRAVRRERVRGGAHLRGASSGPRCSRRAATAEHAARKAQARGHAQRGAAVARADARAAARSTRAGRRARRRAGARSPPRAPRAGVAVGHAPARTARRAKRRRACQRARAQRGQAALAEPRARPRRARRAGELRVASDSELVHRAVKALRRDGDPGARRAAARRASRASPRGPLAEEALSLQIEAALALRSPRAAALAREYLARYPGGRYASVAARALQEARRDGGRPRRAALLLAARLRAERDRRLRARRRHARPATGRLPAADAAACRRCRRGRRGRRAGADAPTRRCCRAADAATRP